MDVKALIDAKSAAIAAVCATADTGATSKAAAILRDQYPFAPEPLVTRKYGPVECTRLFVRDGFTDRYSGAQLVFPPVLRLLSALFPAELPYHPAWKTAVTHPAYWEVGATLDHIVPVTRGGSDSEPNWVTTSMALNFAKMNWTLDELGWHLHPAGSLSEWDGLLRWFVACAKRLPALVAKGSLRQWHRAALLAIAEVDRGGT